MSKLRIFLIFSLVLLAVLFVLTILRPMATGREYSEVARESLLETEDEWIIQFDILNHEGRDTKYTVNFWVAGRQYNEEFLIQDGSRYTYIHHIPRGIAGEASFTISKEGEDTPFEQATYYLEMPASGS